MNINIDDYYNSEDKDAFVKRIIRQAEEMTEAAKWMNIPILPDIGQPVKKPKCPACGLEMGEFMAYVCSRDVCPSGLGSYVSMSC